MASRVRGHPEVFGELPVATLADEILTAGEGQVRALITIAANPMRSTPDTGRLAKALDFLDLIVSADSQSSSHMSGRSAKSLSPAHLDLGFR